MPLTLPEKLQPLLNKIPHWVIALGTAFGAGALAALETADWKPALADLIAGNAGDVLKDIWPPFATAIAAGLTTTAALIRTSKPDEKKLALLSSKVAIQAAMIAAPSPISIPPSAVQGPIEPPPVPK